VNGGVALLRAGDLIWVDFNPALGHEQAGRRPALIISEEAYNQQSSFIIVCPVTRSSKLWPFKLALAEGAPIQGQILIDQMKSIDKRRVVSPPIGKIDEELLSDVRGRLAALLGLAS
jgi:mRNA interferase MazF